MGSLATRAPGAAHECAARALGMFLPGPEGAGMLRHVESREAGSLGVVRDNPSFVATVERLREEGH